MLDRRSQTIAGPLTERAFIGAKSSSLVMMTAAMSIASVQIAASEAAFIRAIKDVLRLVAGRHQPTRQRRRQLGVDEEAQLGDLQDRMVALPGRIFQRRRYVSWLQHRVIGQYLLARCAGGQEVKDVLDADTQSFRLDALPAAGERLLLNLGEVHESAAVRLNGQELGVVWTHPARVDITPAVHAGENRLEISVINLWPNRLIGDEGLPPEKRFTQTNLHKFSASTPLYPSGLLGPVTLESAR